MRAVGLSLVGVVIGVAFAAAMVLDAPVADAARDGDRASVSALLRNGEDANAAHGDGMTALHWAALRGDVEMVRVLLYAGAHLQATTRVGAYTPLLIASKYGRAAVIDLLLVAGAPPDSSTANGTTPLMLAAASGDPASVAALLRHGASVQARETTHGQTALTFAAAGNHVDPITQLIEHGADPDEPSDVIDVVARERAWREAFASRRREAAIRAQAAKAEEPAAENRPAEAAAAGIEPAVADEDPELATVPGTGPVPAAETATGEARAQSGEPASGGEPAPIAEAIEEEPKRLSHGELIGSVGGLTPLHHAVRQGHLESAQALLELGADVNRLSGDRTSPLLMAIVNGHFDLAMFLLGQGADATLPSEAGATPLYAVLNVQWAPKALYPQPRAYTQQRTTHLELMQALLDAGAPANFRLEKKIWYSGYNFDLSGVDESGATAFWRAAYAGDLAAMKLLVAYGADPSIRTVKPPGRPRTGDATRDVEDVSGLAPVPVGGPAVTPLHAAAGAGYGEGFAANSHRHAPGSWLPAVEYLVEELGAEVTVADHEGNTALHHAAARGDNEMILYLVSKGADVTVVNREGQTVADMANGPVQRIQPFPETVALLESLGSKNSNKCVSC